ncbi:MAG: Alpha/beta hydrolase family protein [candidate division WS6 bacterium OLB20]|uniref:Alpha/beta hydrolase family protein n=1 Tax=candidate division WS6 bacterium OLB20 TaxID=1617426 RepID=A0A136LZ38_9BACT|nr:MAG: Alpha/beta hydrolase family protein [candidate division WS6 bacterium OLB20]
MDFEIKLHNQRLRGIVGNEHATDAVILAHGFSGNMHGPDGIFDLLSESLQKEDFAVIRFAFRGTEPSDGEQKDTSLHTETEDLKAVIDWAENKRGYSRIAVLGESFAGGVVANAYRDIVDAVVFWYPLFDFKDCSFREFLNDFNLDQIEKNGAITIDGFAVGRQMYEDISTTVLYDRLTDIKAPALFLHGDADTDVPVQQSEKGYDRAGGIKELGILEGADHCFRFEQDAAVELTTEFLITTLKEA